MDKKTKIFFLVLALLIVYSVAATYYRTYILKDYIISTEIECDPTSEQCFIYTCDPADDPECPADENERASYYKLIKKKEANIAPEVDSCDPHVTECPELSCAPDEKDCQVVQCDPNNLKEDEECSLPDEYNLANPEEEAVECEEGDESCIKEAETCLEGDESCVIEEATECAEGDENCVAEEEATECAEGDESCAQADTAQDQSTDEPATQLTGQSTNQLAE